MALVSQRAYARHRGVSLAAVQKAIKLGRIRTAADGKIDLALADAEWERNTGPRPRPAVAPEPPRAELAAAGSLDYARARAVHENYKARKAKLDYEARLGKLVNSDEVAVAAFNLYRGYRDRMLNLPDRLAAVLAAESDPRRTHQMLAAAIRQALLEFADVTAQNG